MMEKNKELSETISEMMHGDGLRVVLPFEDYVRRVVSIICGLDQKNNGLSLDNKTSGKGIDPKEQEILAQLYMFEKKSGSALENSDWDDFSKILVITGVIKNKKSLATYKSRMHKKDLINSVTYAGARVSDKYYSMIDCGLLHLKIELKVDNELV